jgi:hypothetical protein
MADRLAVGLAAAGLAPVWPVEANEVFVPLPPRIDARLKQQGASYHPWTSDGLPKGIARDADTTPGAPGHVVCDHRRRGRPLRGDCANRNRSPVVIQHDRAVPEYWLPILIPGSATPAPKPRPIPGYG